MSARAQREAFARAPVIPLRPVRATAARLLQSPRSLVVGLALVAVVGILYLAARSTSLFALETVEVKGAPPSLAEEVRRALAPLVGRTLVTIDRDDVVSRVEALPEIASVAYDRAFPHTLVVRVRPERPVGVVRRGARSWLVSPGGRVVRPIVRGGEPRLPRVWVGPTTSITVGAHVADVRVTRLAAALAQLAPRTFPVPVRTAELRGSELVFVLARGVELRLGDGSDLPLKLAVAARVLPRLEAPRRGRTQYLDVSVVGRPVAGSEPSTLR